MKYIFIDVLYNSIVVDSFFKKFDQTLLELRIKRQNLNLRN
jgi:hypothetical protein